MFDFSKMQPVTPGAGGLGTSTSTAGSEIEIALGGDDKAPADDTPTTRHLVALWKQLVGYERNDIRVSVASRIANVHSGFGSNVTFNTGVIAGLNALFGTPFSVPEMFDILTQNFVENADDARLYWGLETGVGEACLFYGGLVWVDEHCRFVGSVSTPESLHVVTATGRVDALASDYLRTLSSSSSGGSKQVGDRVEASVVAEECMRYQMEYGGALKLFLDGRLKPALLRNDLRGLLSLGWELNEVGTFQVLTRIYKHEVLRDVVETVKAEGGLYCNMSSAGPSIFAFVENREHGARLRRTLEEKWSGYFRDFAVGKAGMKLSVDLLA